MRRRMTVILTVIASLALALTAMVATRPAGATGQNGTTLTAYKTATAHLTKTFHWTIDKSVTPDTWDLFQGDSGTSKYTIAVTKDAGTLAAYVDGQICVTNGGVVATEDLTIVDNVTMPPDSTVIASTNVDTSAYPILGAGETHCYDYRVNIPAGSVVPGTTYKDTADINIMNHSGHLGTPFGPGPSATSVMPSSPTLINDTINVDDTNRNSWEFSGNDSVSYDKTFTCDNDKGPHKNTATIRETGQSDDATVTVKCYALTVKKDASTSFTRTWSWTIDKYADQSQLTLAINESYLVKYSVAVGATSEDSNWAVSGNITVSNPAPIDAAINDVSDVVSGGFHATVDCGVTFPYTLPAGQKLECSYDASLPNASDRTNTATATLQNYSYDSEAKATEDGTTDFTGSADVKFSTDPTKKVHECISLSDTFAGAGLPANVCANDLVTTNPKTFTYTRNIGPYTVCGPYTVDNTASFVAMDDSSYTGSDPWTVNVNVPCAGGCTLTIGYWKTHAGFTGNNADMVTPLLKIWLGTPPIAPATNKSVVVGSASVAVTYLSKSGEASNGINRLYAQLLGAKLNIKSGASGTAVASTISAADTFLATKNAADWSSLTNKQRADVNTWATTLDNYNNGLTGPGHCSQ